jgi:hypothetical protein
VVAESRPPRPNVVANVVATRERHVVARDSESDDDDDLFAAPDVAIRRANDGARIEIMRDSRVKDRYKIFWTHYVRDAAGNVAMTASGKSQKRKRNSVKYTNKANADRYRR